jgi:flagellar protein FlbD
MVFAAPPTPKGLGVIAVHRITQPDHELYVNPDLIQVIEANPDTVLVLANGTRYVVSETAAEVADLVRRWRASIVATVEQPSRASARRAAYGRLAAVVELPRDSRAAD